MSKELTRDFAKRCIASGWHGLIDELFNLQSRENFTVVQVKEKFGNLCIYANNVGHEAEKMITEIENRSSRICEICGEKGQKISRGGWLKTRCKDHV